MTGASSAARRRVGAQEPPALADDLADRPCADRGQLAAEVLGDGQ